MTPQLARPAAAFRLAQGANDEFVYMCCPATYGERMREPTYFILAALQDERRHRYAIMSRVAELSSQRVTVATGTFYQAPGPARSGRLIEVVRDEVVNGRAQRH